jgi:GNAT superfamily N-acetyltransferase
MPALEQITPANALAYKTIRLWALQDSPMSFGSTYARESEFTDADWHKRAANLNTERSVGYLAMNEGNYCGIAGAFLDEQNPLRADLVSMWVAPAARRTGVGGALIDAIRSWSKLRGAYKLRLMVTSENHSAIKFYEGMGFSMTGHTEPYPNDPALFEHEMSQRLFDTV